MTAFERAQTAGGKLVLRIEDLYYEHCQRAFADGIMEDLRWLGVHWDEGPDCGGPCGPYLQSLRQDRYLAAWNALMAKGLVYPSPHTRGDVARAMTAPHGDGVEAVFPESLRPASVPAVSEAGAVNWRFRVDYGRTVRFDDAFAGPQAFVAGRDFGDFVVWCRNGWPSYELAVVVDDVAMGITEVVRGEDLLLSTARQLLLYEALGAVSPTFCHCPLVCDEKGVRLAKRNDALSLRELRARGASPSDVMDMWKAR